MDISLIHLETAPQCCPMCDGELYVTRSQPRNGSACPFCRMPLWFLRKSADGVVILTFLAEGKQKSGAVLNDSTLWILQNATRVVANLSRMPSTSNAFMDMLDSLQQKLKSTGGVMKVCGLHPEVEAIFREYEMDTVFEIFPDEKSALEGFNSSENESSSILPMVSELQPGLTNDDLAVSGSMAQYG